MAVANLGSVATNVLARFPDCSAGASGQMLQIVDEQRLYMEERTGLSIGSVGIAEKFQPALTDLSLAAAMDFTRLDGANVANLSLGDFSVGHTAYDPLSLAAEGFKKSGEEKLKRLGIAIRFSRVIG